MSKKPQISERYITSVQILPQMFMHAKEERNLTQGDLNPSYRKILSTYSHELLITYDCHFMK